jgi:hypothetical protein
MLDIRPHVVQEFQFEPETEQTILIPQRARFDSVEDILTHSLPCSFELWIVQ